MRDDALAVTAVFVDYHAHMVVGYCGFLQRLLSRFGLGDKHRRAGTISSNVKWHRRSAWVCEKQRQPGSF